jgi:dienelactone hydrolase
MKSITYLFSAIIILLLSIQPAGAEKTTAYLKYADETVKLDIYNPGGEGCAVAILIHGASGIEGDRATRYENFATDLMQKGIIAINVHYFDSKQNNWVNTILETISYTQKIPNVDKNKIGLIGYSLGGTLALRAASFDNRVKLLATASGFLPAGFTKEEALRLPKILMISGDQDPAINTLNTLRQWLAESGKSFEVKIDKGIGHDNVPMNVFQEDWQTIVQFFVKNL